MTFQEDWRTSFPGVNAANRFIECADDYLDRIEDEPDEVVAEIRAQGWAEDGHEESAEGALEDVVAFCMPED